MSNVAFLLASIHEGTSIRMWQQCLQSFNRKEHSLFVFPGGRLGFADKDEYLRNSIYDLVSDETFDGLMVWASSLTGAASAQETSAYLRRYEKLPMITIGLKVDEKIPVVDFDAYNGFYKMVTHFIRVHKKKHIVYLSGPENHKSSQARYRAYCDALADCGIEFDADLVSSPHPWGQGKEALCEILEKRGLVPSLDFDALVCASDLMLLSAVRHLEELGVAIPSSVAVGGFNDSDSNKLLSVPPTTVRMPASEMVTSAMGRLRLLMQGKDVDEDVLLDSSLVIRRSCGCRDSFSGKDEAAKVIKDTKSFAKWAAAFSGGRIAEEDLEYFVDYAKNCSSEREKEILLNHLRMICRSFLAKGGEPDDLVEITHWFYTLLPLKEELKDFCAKNMDRVILECFFHTVGESQYQYMEGQKIINGFKSELLSIRSLSYLDAAMKEYLPKLGFAQAYLVLKESEEESCLVCGYHSEGEGVEKQVFPSSRLLPSRLEGFISHGCFVVEPVIKDKEAVGYLILEVEESQSSLIIEDIMVAISSAYKGISLMEEVQSARAKAEEIEHSNSEFYANVSEELRNPLKEIRKSLQHVADAGAKGQVINSVLKAEHLLDLILMEKGEVEIKKSMIESASFLKDFVKDKSFSSLSIPDGPLPAIYSDENHLKQAMSITASLAGESGFGQVNFSVQVAPNALCISFSVEGWHPTMLRKNPSLQLAERTVVLLGGSFHFKEHSIMLSLPWPSLSGRPSAVGYGSILFIGGEEAQVPPCLSAFSEKVVMADESKLASSFSLPENLTQIVYDAKAGRREVSVILNLLRNHHTSRDLPFLCFNLESSALDLWSSLSLVSASSSQGSSSDILCLCGIPAGLEGLATFGHLTSFPTFDELLSSIETTASLIILNECKRESIEEIRKNRFTSQTPVLIVKDHFTGEEIDGILSLPSVLICNTSICASEEFLSRLIGIFGGNQILPPLTGALVKRVIMYINRNGCRQISRWQIADSVNISEDYMTRIFKKDMGISPWDYLNRYRIQMACEYLKTTGKTLNEIASETGFQDQAYFCRVFRRIVGVAPGKMRK